MNTDFEPVMSALFANLVASAAIPFTADTTSGSATLANAGALAGLFPGLPVFGLGVARGATIVSLDVGGKTITLSAPVVGSGAGSPFTTGFLTTGRRVPHWSQVKAQPALFLRRIGAVDEYDHDSFFSRTTLECEAWIYCNTGNDPLAAPDAGLTILEQLVRDSFAPDADYGDPRYTVGGLAYWCRIDGRTDSSPGDQGDQALARIPIKITLP